MTIDKNAKQEYRSTSAIPSTDTTGGGSRMDKHAVGGAIGAAAGTVAGAAAVGAAAGAAAGPVGLAAGAVAGAMLGGLAGKDVASWINPTAEEKYWQENFAAQDYVKPGSDYDLYRPAYRYGVESYVRYDGRDFDEIEAELGRDWTSKRETSTLGWDEARFASRDAYNRLAKKNPNKA